MSTTLANPTEEKSEDKKEIEDEEREKMLNEENKRTGAAEEGEEVVIKPVRREGEGEVEKMRKALEESEKESVKKKIPIGGIKMPGFLRSRSREKTKEGELDVEEGKDLLQEPPCIATNATPSDAGTDKEQTPPSKGPRLPSLKLANPFSKKKDQGGEGTEAGDAAAGDEERGKKAGLLEAIRLPLVSVFPRSKLKPTKDPELGQQAGLASMETLDDSMGEKTEKMTNGDDGMESVKLDTEEKMDPDKKEELDEKEDWRERVRALSKFKLIVGGSVIILILLIIIVAIAPFGSHHYTAPIPVEEEHFKEALTACGPVEGLVEDGAFAFRGIPYAVQPMGKRRWKPAEPLNKLESCWDGVLPVHNSTAPCWQIYPSGKIDGAEDCLTLDIFTPQVGYMNPLPVVVLVGAESLSGGSPGALRPSALLARDKDVVFVRPNFRLGVLGFLAAEILKNDSYPPTSGNYGLSDLVVVLRWINLNIEHFGGDKNAVTLLGHRAGGTLVTALTASRETKGLFLNAWVSSGAGIFPGIELIESERVSAEFVETLQCGNDLECLRKKDTEELLDSVPELWRHPLQDLPRTDDESSSLKHQWLVLDGKYLQKHVTDAWKTNGLHANLVMGSTVHADVPPKLYDNWTGEQVENHVKSSVVGSKNLTSEALHRYGADWPGLIAMISDIRTVCPLLYLSLSYKEKIIPFYLVNHTRISSHSQSSEPLADVSVDVEAILGQYEGETHSQKKYVESMQELFYHFVRHGSLKNEKSLGVNQGLLINENVIPIRSFSNCEFWFAKDIAPRHGRID